MLADLHLHHTRRKSTRVTNERSHMCSYVLLIVDTRNITGRHPPGNAWGSVRNASREPAKVCWRCPYGLSDGGLSYHAANSIPQGDVDFAHQWQALTPVLHQLFHARLTRSHSSFMVRRNVVPQPLVVLGFVGRRIRRARQAMSGELIAEDLVNCISQRLRMASSQATSSVTKITFATGCRSPWRNTTDHCPDAPRWQLRAAVQRGPQLVRSPSWIAGR